ncbi:MAG TPA: pyridoxal phosphate-dependent aminotransferase [Candidatus Angelobacter sp.]
MSTARADARSLYMEWAKLHSTAKFNLATSGMTSLPLAELDVKIEQLEINGPGIYGYEPLLQALAERYRVPQSCVVSAIGTSLANYLAVAAATEPGDEILIEQPAYDPLLGIARYLGLQIRRFQRPAEQNFAIDLNDLKRNLTLRTRLIVITNMHNPSGMLCPDRTLKEVAALARGAGAFVLVDEVYRELLFEDRPRTAFDIDREHFMVTSSLTKAYGLSGLRCGWVLAPPHLAERMWRINDLHGATFIHPGELLSVAAMARLSRISARMKSLLDENRKLLRQFLDSHPQLHCPWPEYGTIVFPRLLSGNTAAFCEVLHQQFETSVVPGRFFECPERFRIGVGTTTEEVRAALEQLGKGLEQASTLF